jgi:4-diphosphocytidyl-2-C-methyl-D-erythritol kinase
MAAEALALARAKVNLTLHVTGRRDDGYHLLDSLVVFAGIGDRLRIAPAPALSLAVTGPFADGVPTDGGNLVLRAAEALRAARGVRDGAAIVLEKDLPHGGGIGGGSADAAAALGALAALWQVAPLGADEALALGADVPVCMAGPAPQWMRGIGERVAPAQPLPPFRLVLVNPGASLPTPRVFRAGAFSAEGVRTGPGAPPPRAPGLEAFTDWLAAQRNDLEAPALRLAPVIAEALAALRARTGCRLARMSGSGSTVWGLFETAAGARDAAASIARDRPSWWVRATGVASGPG